MADNEQRPQAQAQHDEGEAEAFGAGSSSGPLVSDPMAVLVLKAEYVGNANANFMHGIDALNRKYEALRRVRGDGNCFFRGFIFALCEQLLPPRDARAEPAVLALRARIQETIRQSKSELVAIGYSEVAIDAFWETFVDYLAAMETRSHAELGEILCSAACVAELLGGTAGADTFFVVHRVQCGTSRPKAGSPSTWYARAAMVVGRLTSRSNGSLLSAFMRARSGTRGC
jgi:hypothetical protein